MKRIFVKLLFILRRRFLEEKRVITDGHFFGSIQGLNAEEKHFFQSISAAVESNLNGKSNQLLYSITGGAESGKSFVSKLILEYISRCYTPTVDIIPKLTFIRVASYTGVAVRKYLVKLYISYSPFLLKKSK